MEVEMEKILSNGQENKEESKFNSNNTALVLNRYAYDIVSEFNDRHRTKFQCVMGATKGKTAQSTLNKQNHCINIVIPEEYLAYTDKSKVDALKIMVGHELSHQLYANMAMSILDTLAMCKDRVAGIYRRVIMSCSIETAADIAGLKFYTNKYGEPDDEVYAEYLEMIKGGQEENEKTIVTGLKAGYLPPSYRVKLMRKFKSFTANNYECLEQIIDDIYYLGQTFMNKELMVHRYFSWIKVQFEMDNFTKRPNRIRS